MGHGSYTASDWIKLSQSRGINDRASVKQLFLSGKMKEANDPRYIHVRESCDSADSPESTPIILAFDVTASMGYLAEEIAKNALNNTVQYIYDKQPVSNPHVMCAAFGNYPDKAPLQVTQFEADIRVVEQLLDLWIEQCGWCFSGDTYVWYFAAKHTKIDCFDKRAKKGFLFTMGDDICDHDLEPVAMKTIFNDDDTNTYTPAQLIAMASEKYELYHIVTKPIKAHVADEWNKLLPGRVAIVNGEGVALLAQIIVSIMQLANGKDRQAVIGQWLPAHQPVIAKAIEQIDPSRLFADEEQPTPKKRFGLFGR